MGCLKLERLEQKWIPMKVIHKAEWKAENSHVNYYPFGLELSTSLTGDFAYRYNGKEKETGLDLNISRYGARSYNMDYIVFDGVDPLSDHPDQVHKSPYVYGSNNPVRYQDYEGLLPVESNQGPGDPPLGAVIAGTIRAGYLQIGYNTVRRFKIWGGADPSSIPYRRFSVHEDAISATGVSVGYEDIYEEPSVGRKVLDNTLAALDVTAVVPSNGLATFAKSPGMFVSDIARSVTKNFGNLECTQCTDALVSAFKKEGLHGNIVTLQSNQSKRGFIYSNSADDIISVNGRHQGVLIDGKVYDNIHKSGIKYKDWLKDFDVLGGFGQPSKERF